MGMRCKGRVFRDTGQGANFMVVLIGLVLIFKQQMTDIVNDIFRTITNQSGKILR